IAGRIRELWEAIGQERLGEVVRLLRILEPKLEKARRHGHPTQDMEKAIARAKRVLQ
ncbi:MAG: hypothetical protein GX606_00165, partial [Elusimicrobia bacterium]|nr:hypothetical protein [Elusimicrobiota bacterium]